MREDMVYFCTASVIYCLYIYLYLIHQNICCVSTVLFTSCIAGLLLCLSVGPSVCLFVHQPALCFAPSLCLTSCRFLFTPFYVLYPSLSALPLILSAQLEDSFQRYSASYESMSDASVITSEELQAFLNSVCILHSFTSSLFFFFVAFPFFLAKIFAHFSQENLPPFLSKTAFHLLLLKFFCSPSLLQKVSNLSTLIWIYFFFLSFQTFDFKGVQLLGLNWQRIW